MSASLVEADTPVSLGIRTERKAEAGFLYHFAGDRYRSEEQAMFDPLHELIATVIDVAPDRVVSSTLRADLDEWDSLAQLGVIAAIEETYGITLTTAEMQECVGVAAIGAVLQRHGVTP